MLEIKRLPRRSAVSPLMDDFDPDRATWVVSDLRSKFELQQRLLETRGGYLDTSVLRASDLWKMLLKKVRPDIRLVSRDFARSLVRAFLAEHREALDLKTSSERAVMSAMDRFAPIVYHPNGDALMDEWFEANPESHARWGASYLVARVALKYLRDRKVTVSTWAASLLQSEGEFERFWDQDLIVDLGADLASAEVHLFLRLSKKNDVTLLEPDPAWRPEAELLLRAYRDVEGAAAGRVSRLADPGAKTVVRDVLRVSGQLAEIKTAVATARAWLDEGLAPSEIAILAPDIEDYWPVLKAYLDEEGLPADKSVAVKLNSFPSVCRWLSKLRPKKGDLTPEDLELSVFSGPGPQRIRSEEFHALYAGLYGEEDVGRHDAVERLYREGPRFSEKMKRDEFLLAAAQLWGGEAVAPLLLIGREILQNAGADMELPLREWIAYSEAVAASREVGVEPGRGDGILVTNFPSARLANLRRRIFLNLNEEALKKNERSPLPLEDLRRLSELGFHLDHPDHSAMEFELRWLADNPGERDVFLTGASSFEGSVQTPSSLWLQLRREAHPDLPSEKIAAPEPTRWDLLRAAKPEAWGSERTWDEVKSAALLTRLKVDLGDEDEKPLPMPLPERISPSLVKRYFDCPFLVAGSTLFRLKDLDELDLDLRGRSLGELLHAVFQHLTDEGWTARDQVSDEEIAELITKVRHEKDIALGEERWWGPFLRRQVTVVREFLNVEKKWKAQFPKLRLLKSEQEWKLVFDPVTGGFSKGEAGEGKVLLTGRLDRLETDGEGRYVVIDYKASSHGLFNQRAWLRENDLQLLFYMWALEKGSLEGVEGRAVGAFYYVYKDFSRRIGFQVEDEAGGLFPAARKGSHRSATAEEKQQLFNALEERIATVVRSWQEGRWRPEPRKEEICERCTWNGLCRASHLN